MLNSAIIIMQRDYEYTTDEVIGLVEKLGYGPNLIDYYTRSIPFHTYAAPGMLIGVFMVDYAVELLDARIGEKLFVVSETQKCLPDPVQVILNSTIGNNRLKVVPIGRFAITVNRPSIENYAEGIRVFLDSKKLDEYPVLKLWFTNSHEFDKKTMSKVLTEQILTAGRKVLSFEKVRIPVTQKKKWNSIKCPVCGEDVPEYMMEDGRCSACGSLKYYEEI